MLMKNYLKWEDRNSLVVEVVVVEEVIFEEVRFEYQSSAFINYIVYFRI